MGVEVRQCSHGGREVERAPRERVGGRAASASASVMSPSAQSREELRQGEIQDASSGRRPSSRTGRGATVGGAAWLFLGSATTCLAAPRRCPARVAVAADVAFQSSPPPQVCSRGKDFCLYRQHPRRRVEDVVRPAVGGGGGFDLGGPGRASAGGFFLKGPNIVPPVASLPIQWRGVRRCKSWPGALRSEWVEYGGRHRGTEARRPTRLAARRRETRFYRGW